SDAVVVRRGRSRNRLTHTSPRVGLLFVRDLVERGLVRLLRLGGLAFLLGALLLRLGMLPAALAAHLRVSRRHRHRDARQHHGARQSYDDGSHSSPPERSHPSQRRRSPPPRPPLPPPTPPPAPRHPPPPPPPPP